MGRMGATAEDLSRENATVSEIVKELTMETESTDWGLIIVIILGVAIVIIIIIALVLRYR